ncbi:MAG: glycosyltransferase family 39 protein [Bacteroidetes bacterium]|nr:glycosyltransferase family 39 protein [Bacteroidota bacterium]
MQSTVLINYRRYTAVWIFAATIVRLLLATQLELGIDEVYYWNYVIFPDWSYFDHPLMVGVLGDIFSLHHTFQSDFLLRLGPICLSALSTWIIFRIGTKVKDERTGFYAALLFTGSIYCSIIAGFSYIPDGPLIIFWLLALNLMLDFLGAETIDSVHRRKIILFGVFAGLAMISKYQGAFLWVGVFAYVFLYNRNWLREFSFYVSGVISAILLLPILIWNLNNDFVTFNYHSGRVTPKWEFRADYFFTELSGQFAYNNPVVYVLIVIALVALFKGKKFIDTKFHRILLSPVIPLWLVFTGFSVFRSTLPHWSAPAFVSLIILAAAYWAGHENQKKAYFWMKAGAYFLAFLLAVALWLINYSPLQLGKKSDLTHFGEDDFTQDLYGWKQVRMAFEKVAAREEQAGTMPAGAGILTYKMFPAAHLDFYVAEPNNRKLQALGTLEDIHMYAWIYNYRKGLDKGQDYYHIALSNLYREPQELFGNYFERIEPMDTIEISRAGKPMRYAMFYRLRNYQGNYVNPLPSDLQ